MTLDEIKALRSGAKIAWKTKAGRYNLGVYLNVTNTGKVMARTVRVNLVLLNPETVMMQTAEILEQWTKESWTPEREPMDRDPDIVEDEQEFIEEIFSGE